MILSATDAELAVEASIPKDARQEATIHGWEERNASSMPASKRERWILWLIRAARVRKNGSVVTLQEGALQEGILHEALLQDALW